MKCRKKIFNGQYRVYPGIMQTMDTTPTPIERNPTDGRANASVIWLHGLGADGNDFVPIVEQFRFSSAHPIRFVFPHAPIRPVTVNGGMHMRAWYDILGLDFSRGEDRVGLQESEQCIHQLIEREISLGIPTERITLAGFSQGGALSLYTGLRYPHPLASIIALSAYLPTLTEWATVSSVAHRKTPIFMAHGLFDPIVPLTLAQSSCQKLESLGHAIQWHTYSMAHSVLPEEILDIRRFLQSILHTS